MADFKLLFFIYDLYLGAWPGQSFPSMLIFYLVYYNGVIFNLKYSKKM